jgi:DNA-binding helix-hairpin-helix protein with protein kinase domain
MKTLYARAPDGSWRRFKYDDSGRAEPGTEGRVYRAATGDMVIKLFNESNQSYLAEKQRKIQAMLQPDLLSYFAERENPDFAWPICTVHSQKEGAFIGFGMRNLSGYDPLAELFSTTSPIGQKFTELERVQACAYLAHLFWLAHNKGVLIGDVKPDNIRINADLQHLAIIDCDSFQISDKGTVLTSNVGTREYISPRLISEIESRGRAGRFQGVVRVENDDDFCLAIICFRILMGGYHPFQSGRPGSKIFDNIRKHDFPYAGGNPGPPRNAPIDYYNKLPTEIKELFRSAFKEGVAVSAKDWRRELFKHAKSLESKPTTKARRPSVGRTSSAAPNRGQLRGVVTPATSQSSSGPPTREILPPWLVTIIVVVGIAIAIYIIRMMQSSG